MDRWQRLQQIFEESHRVLPSERAALLQAMCAGDNGLREEAERLLAVYDADQQQQQLRPGIAGARFGAWRATKLLGRGGMGEVWLAERADGHHQQQAALKVIAAGFASTELAHRFRRERQLLALLEHPNIARLLDGGISDTGTAYLVMEYVDGIPVDEFCRSRALSVHDRLSLFRKICAAVRYAHQHLVIHRDLKPSNILVDSNAEPKLLDFGIAKLLAEGEQEGSGVTRTALSRFTPEFASPEQLQGLPCTVAADVYSLGVLLYGLLAERSPYGDVRRRSKLLSVILSGNIPRPSVVAPEPVRRNLRGDLDGIILKALAKRPEDRYASVDQLSEDVRRHQEALPVSAIEGTQLYLARKILNRHRTGVAATAIVLFSLVAGLAGTLWQARVARSEQHLAEQRFSDARELANYLLFPLYDSVQRLPGSLPVRADMTNQSLRYLDRLAAARANDPALQVELAEGYTRLGAILEAPVGSGDSLGNTTLALSADQKALGLLDGLVTRTDPRVMRDRGEALRMLGDVLNLTGKPDAGIANLQESARIFDQLAKRGDTETLIEAGRTYLALADVRNGRGGGFVSITGRDQALAAENKAISYFEAARRQSPSDVRTLIGLAYSYNLKGTTLAVVDVGPGLPAYTKGLEMLSLMPAADRSRPAYAALEARLRTMIGYCEGELGHYEAALSSFAFAESILETLASAEPTNASNAFRQVNLYRSRARIEQEHGTVTPAIEDYKRTIHVLDGMIVSDPRKMSWQLVRAQTQGSLAQLLWKANRRGEATTYSRASIAFLTHAADAPDAPPQNLEEAAAALMDAPDASPADLRRALAYAQRSNEAAKGKDFIAMFYVAQCYEHLGQGAEALSAIRKAIALLPPDKPGQKSQRRLRAEKHLENIQYLVHNGRLRATEK